MTKAYASAPSVGARSAEWTPARWRRYARLYLREMRERLDRMGPVNILAVEEEPGVSKLVSVRFS